MTVNPDFNSSEERTDTEISEDSLRLALDRLGARTPRRSSPSSHVKNSSEPRRRRFVQEGQVVVEHHQTSRTAQRAASVPNDDQSDEINRVRNLLKLEQRRAEDAQRELADAQVQLRTLETHLVHEKLSAKELKTRCAELEQSLLEAQMQLSQLREAAIEPKAAAVQAGGDVTTTHEETPLVADRPRRPGRPPKARRAEEFAGEPEPVRWWRD